MSTSLTRLPEDVVLDILTHLDTARDVAHFATASQWTRGLTRRSGWQDFVRLKFPSLRLPAAPEWESLADRLTYQDRCWNQRGFRLTLISEPAQSRHSARPANHSRQSIGFQSVLTAGVLSCRPDEELLVLGAGEDILLRRRRQQRRRPAQTHDDVWAGLSGHDMGYEAGTGDVTAVSILERGGSSAEELAVGRATGELQLLSADAGPGFGRATQTLVPLNQQVADRRPSPGQTAVAWTEWEPRNQVLASSSGSLLTLHSLGTEEPFLHPVTHYDASTRDESAFVKTVKFMTPDLLACGLGGSRQPLRWAHVRPDGLDVGLAASNSLVFNHEDKVTTVRAMEPVRGMNPNILLSAWDDGSHRLADLRTPSPHDALYRDRFQPFQASSSMLVYGCHRFVAGSNCGADLRFFDFRLPTPYSHSDALPCSPDPPLPHRPQSARIPLQWPPPPPPRGKAQCEPQAGQRCVRHAEMAHSGWQPDATLHVGGHASDRVYSLAKASDSSDSFCVGFRGLMAEVTLSLAGEAAAASTMAPEGWTARPPKKNTYLIETGVGRWERGEKEEGCSLLPKLYHHEPRLAHKSQGWSRLDEAFRAH